jgi:heme/copper-type cytochrome/quinol oxidase subunit 2
VTDGFRRSAAEFIERYRMPDGSVYPRLLAPDPVANAHAGHTMAAAPPADGHGDAHGGAGAMAATQPIDVYLLAERWFYEPSDLRLDVGVDYRFRMLAADVSHGASIQFGSGARMIRLRPDTVAEMDVSFTSPGSYLVYCTVYCGQAHDVMQARIEVI